LAAALADEIESGGPSPVRIGAPGQGDTECDEKDESEFMDPTSTEAAGASSSPEQIAAKLLSRSRQKQKLVALPMRPERKSKGAR
jgi:hypothetical protein